MINLKFPKETFKTAYHNTDYRNPVLGFQEVSSKYQDDYYNGTWEEINKTKYNKFRAFLFAPEFITSKFENKKVAGAFINRYGKNLNLWIYEEIEGTNQEQLISKKLCKMPFKSVGSKRKMKKRFKWFLRNSNKFGV